jgi:hypothetical protein
VAGGEKKVDLDADPLALLPSAAVVVANVDARLIFEKSSVGDQIAAIANKLVPLGDEGGFSASRDVDRVVIASYATGGLDVAAVLSGRFDPSKIAAATKSQNGAAIVRGAYAGRPTYTVGGAMYAPLTSKTLVAGSGDGLRRLLERVQANTVERSLPAWVVDTLDTKGAAIAVAADLETQPIVSASLGSAHLAWLKGMRVARAIANFDPPGMNVAATLTYGDPEQARTAADGLHFAEVWLKVLGPLLGGVRLQNLQIATDANDLRCKFTADDQTVRTILALAPRLLQTSP